MHLNPHVISRSVWRNNPVPASLLSSLLAALTSPLPRSPAPYAEALLQREYELWQRQSEMFERLQAQHATDLARFDGERAAWQATEAVLRQEAAELRAQLLFLISQLGAATAAGGGPVVGGAMQQQQQQPAAFSAASQAALVGREPAGALPGGSRFGSSASSPVAAAAGGGPSPGEQVKALVDAMRAGAGRASNGASPASAASSSSSSSSCSSSMPVSAGEAWPQGADSELPDYAAELAAALAAVENTDVLSGLGAYTSAAARRGARAAPAAEHAAPPAPTQHTPPAAAAPAQAAATAPAAAAAAQPAAPEAAANAELAAELAATGPPPMLTVGADDIFWVTQACGRGRGVGGWMHGCRCDGKACADLLRAAGLHCCVSPPPLPMPAQAPPHRLCAPCSPPCSCTPALWIWVTTLGTRTLTSSCLGRAPCPRSRPCRCAGASSPLGRAGKVPALFCAPRTWLNVRCKGGSAGAAPRTSGPRVSACCRVASFTHRAHALCPDLPPPPLRPRSAARAWRRRALQMRPRGPSCWGRRWGPSPPAT